jgi:type IV pilus secretin PilQ/predicted competence protein
MIFLAAAAACTGSWLAAADKPSGNSSSDPFASSPATPATQPSADATSSDSAAPATQPADKGQSVTASQVNVSDAGTVEIHVNDANLVEVLRMLSLQSQRNIIASKEVHGTVTANLYDVTVREALDAILHANGYDYREKGSFIYVYTTKEIQEMEQAQRVKKTEVFRLFYTPAANAKTMVMPVLSSDAQIALTTPSKAGLSTGASGNTGGDDHAGEDMLVITDFQENLDKARKILREVDRRPQQVLVEATILSASLNENNSLGIDFTVLGGVNFATLAGISGASGSGGTGGTGSTGSTGGTGSTGSGSGSGTTGSGGPTNSAGVNSGINGSILDNAAAKSILSNGAVSAVQFGGHGLNAGVITNNVAFFIQALETVTDTTILANPKVLVLNKQQGEVHIGKNIGYKTAVATETLTASSVSFLDTGIRLLFRPHIGDDGYIRLEVHPEDSDGSIDANGNPQKSTTEITSNIMVRDGRTVVIGGLFADSTTRARSQVPFLGSLPGVGVLFRQQSDATIRQEIIILLTPHIIKDYDQYGAASEEEAKYAERLEVGARKGLMFWGRERLAESWYDMAVSEMAKPHPNRNLALWHLNCAIHLNPMFSEAMELRAQITGAEMTATDNSTIRSFVRKQIMNDRANPTTLPAAEPVVSIEPNSPNPTTDHPKSARTTVLSQAPATQPATNVSDTTNEPADKTPATQPTVTASTTDPKDDQGNNPDHDDQ